MVSPFFSQYCFVEVSPGFPTGRADRYSTRFGWFTEHLSLETETQPPLPSTPPLKKVANEKANKHKCRLFSVVVWANRWELLALNKKQKNLLACFVSSLSKPLRV